MGIPLDIEDILGSSVVEVLKRGALFFGGLLLASFLAAFSLSAGDAIAHPSRLSFDLELSSCLLIWILPLTSLWIFVYVPVVLWSAYRFFTGESSFPQPFLNVVAAEAVLILLSVPEPDLELALAVLVLGGCLMALRHLCLVIANRWRSDLESHLIGLARENEIRRAGLRDTHGTDIAGADYHSDGETSGRD